MNAKLLSILLSVHVITPSSNKKFATSFTATLSLRYPTAAFQFQIAKMSEQDTTCGDVDVDACADRKQLSKNALKKRWKKEAVERKKAEKVAMRVSEFMLVTCYVDVRCRITNSHYIFYPHRPPPIHHPRTVATRVYLKKQSYVPIKRNYQNYYFNAMVMSMRRYKYWVLPIHIWHIP